MTHTNTLAIAVEEPETGKLIGGIYAKADGEFANIEFLYVDDSFRGLGIGQTLLLAAESHFAKQDDIKFALLKTPSWQGEGFYDAKCGYNATAIYPIDGGRETIYTKPKSEFAAYNAVYQDGQEYSATIKGDARPYITRILQLPHEQDKLVGALIDGLDQYTASEQQPEWGQEPHEIIPVKGDVTWNCLHISGFSEALVPGSWDDERLQNHFSQAASTLGIQSAVYIADGTSPEVEAMLTAHMGFNVVQPPGAETTQILTWENER